MATLDLEADKACLVDTILSIDNASVLAEVKKQVGKVLNLSTANTSKHRTSSALTKRMVRKYAGAWSDSRSTDEIIDDIYASRVSHGDEELSPFAE